MSFGVQKSGYFVEVHVHGQRTFVLAFFALFFQLVFLFYFCRKKRVCSCECENTIESGIFLLFDFYSSTYFKGYDWLEKKSAFLYFSCESFLLSISTFSREWDGEMRVDFLYLLIFIKFVRSFVMEKIVVKPKFKLFFGLVLI